MQEPTTNASTGNDAVTTDTSTPTVSDTTATDATTTSVTSTESASSSVETPVSASVATTAVAEAPVVTPEVPTSPVVAAVNPLRQQLKQYGIATLIVILMGGALWYLLEKQGRVQTGVFDKITALVMPEPAVAKVNGEKIPKSLYDKNYEQLSAQAAAQGADAADPSTAEQIKKQSIDVLVNSVLLKQAARNGGVVVTEEQINERYQSIVDAQGGEEALAARMAELNITKESLMQDIEDEILIQTHLDTAIKTDSIEVTKEEVDALYKSVTSNPEVDVPPLEEVRTQIEQEIRYGKQQELISEYIDTLKKDATIEVLI